jgi:isopentenyl diphosphate isomerase/L-lactate dehydrogenase-like FMN-dependent dehydrogenase
LPDIVAAVGDRMTVLFDSGVRRGTDVVKALALGARAVLVGRPPLWGLSVSGAAGVQAVMEHLHDEMVRAMQLCGASSLAALTPDLVKTRPPSFRGGA